MEAAAENSVPRALAEATDQGIGIIATGDHMDRRASTGDLIKRGEFPCR